MKETILTGVRANEEPTLGNYLGAYVPMVQLAQKHASTHQINMFVPDLHSFTTPIDHSTLYANIIKGVKYYIAAGLDIENPNIDIYRQSFIPAHSELTWILDCFTNFGEMKRMTQFKDKTAEVKILEDVLSPEFRDTQIHQARREASVSVGLFNYPVLMAADILLYDAKYVPLGEDQFQHLEITRDIGERMNNKFGELFTLPEPTAKQMEFMGRDEGLRVRSLTDPTKKMSKSATDEKSKILLGDDPEVAAKKIMGATTDSVGKVQFDMFNQPGISNLLQILSLLKGQSLENVTAEWAGVAQYGEFKAAVADEVKVFLTNFQAKVAEISDEYVLEKLEESEARMNEVAKTKLLEVQRVVGLRK